MSDDQLFPATVYGSSISYFTGKLENYFRIKGIPYRFQPMTAHYAKVMKEKLGSTQMPAVELADGRWLTDTTPMIQWFEQQVPTPPVIPDNPLQRFFSLLLEDYADEWLWRPAMHYRWDYERGARFGSTHLVEELATDVHLPVSLKRMLITRRQRGGYTYGDGIVKNQVPLVEAIYRRTLEQLEAIFRQRPFLLGERPSLADIGFAGPVFRHFGLDPVPAEIMRQEAPAVWEWSARLWNTRPEDLGRPLLSGMPEDWGPILDEIGSHYLPYLCANNEAVAAGNLHFDAEIGGISYRRARRSPYRVWCLQELRRHFNELPEGDQPAARQLLEAHGCWEPLWRHTTLPVKEAFCSHLPFQADAKMVEVYE